MAALIKRLWFSLVVGQENHEVGVVEGVEAVNPPAVRDGIEGVGGVLDIGIAGVAGDAAGVGVLGGKNGGDGLADEHRAVELVEDVLHALVEGLNAGGDIGVVMNALERAMGKEIQFDVVEPPVGKFTDVVVDARQGGGMGEVHSQCAVIGFETAGGVVQEGLAVSVTAALDIGRGGVGGGAPPDEGGPINTGLLAVGVAIIDKGLQLRGAHVVPIGIEVDVDEAIVVESVALQILPDESGGVGGFGVIDPGLKDAPTVPAKGDAVGPGQFRGKQRVLIGEGLHGDAPIGAKADEDGWGTDGVAGERAVGHDVPGDGGGDGAAEDVHLV